MRLVATALIALALLVGAPSPAAGQTDSAAIDSFIESEMRDLSIPGAAVGVVEGDRIVHLRGFGDGGGRAVTPQTPFRLASTSKAFTALAVMQLVEAGKLDLDRTVRSYLPWFTSSEWAASGRITARQLLNQTSGFSTATGNADGLDDDVAPGALERAVRRLSAQSLISVPGAEFHYSNSNYQVLGLLVEKTSGEEFGGYLQRHVFEPLEMHHTHTTLAAARADGLAQGYYGWFGLAVLPTDFPVGTAGVAASAIFSSAEDMTHALVAHLNSGRYNDHALVSPDKMGQLHTGTATVPGYATTYAMGWFVHPLFGNPALDSTSGEYRLPEVVDHTGGWSNYHSVMVLLPGLRRGAVFLANRYDGTISGRYSRIQFGLERILVGQPPPPPDFVGDSWLASNGRLILGGALAFQLIALGIWLWRRRWSPKARRARIARAGAVITVTALDFGALAFMWLVVPGMFDEWWFTLPRTTPDVGLLMVAFTLTAAIWIALSVVAASRLVDRGSPAPSARRPAPPASPSEVSPDPRTSQSEAAPETSRRSAGP